MHSALLKHNNTMSVNYTTITFDLHHSSGTLPTKEVTCSFDSRAVGVCTNADEAFYTNNCHLELSPDSIPVLCSNGKSKRESVSCTSRMPTRFASHCITCYFRFLSCAKCGGTAASDDILSSAQTIRFCRPFAQSGTNLPQPRCQRWVVKWVPQHPDVLIW